MGVHVNGSIRGQGLGDIQVFIATSTSYEAFSIFLLSRQISDVRLTRSSLESRLSAIRHSHSLNSSSL